MSNTFLESLLSSIPQQPERHDEMFPQMVELSRIASKLGMVSAYEYLETNIAIHRKYHEPLPLHPEQQRGEVFLMNCEPSALRYIGWKTKRAGTVALNQDSIQIADQVPVFVMAAELEASGQLDPRQPIKE